MVKYTYLMKVFTILLPLLMAQMIIISAADHSFAALKSGGNSDVPQNVEKCMYTIQDKFNKCASKYNPERSENRCEAYYEAFACYVEEICSKCDHDDAIDAEKVERKAVNELIKFNEMHGKCKPNYTPPKSLDSPFCTPSSGFPVWAIILIALVVLTVCCCTVGLILYYFCFASNSRGHTSHSGSGHSSKSHQSKGGKHHSSGGHSRARRPSHHSHN